MAFEPFPAFEPGRPKWWQWPTILSLDAPAVVITWQALLGRVVAAPLAWFHEALLGASVWLAYSADRWIEGWRLTDATVRTQRHYYSMRWRWRLFILWALVLVASVTGAFHFFHRREWLASLSLLLPTFLYLFSHQFLHRDHPLRVPKEICVAIILSVGAALYPGVLAGDRWSGLIGPTLLFFGLALANCYLISEWERDVDRAHSQVSLALQFRLNWRLSRALIALIFGFGLVLAGVGRRGLRVAGGCGAASAFLLLILAAVEPKIGRERARVLVDWALLTPLFFLGTTWM